MIIWNNRKNALHLPNSTGGRQDAYVIRPGKNEVDEEVFARALGNSTLHKWIESGWITREQQHVAIARPSLEFEVDPETGKAIPPGFAARGGPDVARGPGGFGTSADLVRPGAPDRELLEASKRAVEERRARRGLSRRARQVGARGGDSAQVERGVLDQLDAASRAVAAAERDTEAARRRAREVDREREEAKREAELERARAAELEREVARLRAEQSRQPVAPGTDASGAAVPDAPPQAQQPDAAREAEQGGDQPRRGRRS
jgi:hypothetical protein